MQFEHSINNINIRRVDLGTPEELNLLLDDQREVRWTWKAMEDVYSDVSLRNLEKKLSKLADIKRQGRVFNILDMTLDNNFPARCNGVVMAFPPVVALEIELQRFARWWVKRVKTATS